MSVELEKKYSREEVRGRLGRWMLFAGVCFLALIAIGIVGLSMMKAPAPGSEATRVLIFLILGPSALFALMVLAVRLKEEARELSIKLVEMLRTAQQLSDGDALFHLFRPTQERADVELCNRGQRMGDAVRALTEFLGRHPEVVAARAKGNPSDLGGDVLKEEETLQKELDEAKAAFWSLHSMLWRVSDRAFGYHLEDSWQKYDVDVLRRPSAAVKGGGGVEASDGLQTLAEGRNEPPGQ